MAQPFYTTPTAPNIQEVQSKDPYPLWPNELKTRRRYLVRRNKEPYNALNGERASVPDPDEWSSYDQACSTAATGKFDGAGFALEHPYFGVDLDNALTEEGQVKTWAREIVDTMPNTYWEISPSGQGLHGIGKGRKPGPNCKRKIADGKLEIYDRERYFTMTGNHLAGTATVIGECSEALAKIYNQYLANEESQAPTAPATATVSNLRLSDDEIDAKLSRAANSAKYSRLMAGDASDYPDDSADGVDLSLADNGLALMLAFYTDEAAQIERMMDRGQLARRAKWRRADYRRSTIDDALSKTTTRYTPRLLPNPTENFSLGLQPAAIIAPEPIPFALIPKNLLEVGAPIPEDEPTRLALIISLRHWRKSAIGVIQNPNLDPVDKLAVLDHQIFCDQERLQSGDQHETTIQSRAVRACVDPKTMSNWTARLNGKGLHLLDYRTVDTPIFDEEGRPERAANGRQLFETTTTYTVNIIPFEHDTSKLCSPTEVNGQPVRRHGKRGANLPPCPHCGGESELFNGLRCRSCHKAYHTAEAARVAVDAAFGSPRLSLVDTDYWFDDANEQSNTAQDPTGNFSLGLAEPASGESESNGKVFPSNNIYTGENSSLGFISNYSLDDAPNLDRLPAELRSRVTAPPKDAPPKPLPDCVWVGPAPNKKAFWVSPSWYAPKIPGGVVA